MQLFVDYQLIHMEIRIACHINHATVCPQLLNHCAGSGPDAAGIGAVADPYADVEVLHRPVFCSPAYSGNNQRRRAVVLDLSYVHLAAAQRKIGSAGYVPGIVCVHQEPVSRHMAVLAPGNQRHTLGLRFADGDVAIAGKGINKVSGCNLISAVRNRIDTGGNIAFICPQDYAAIGILFIKILGCVYIPSQEYIALSVGYGADAVSCHNPVRHMDIAVLRLQRCIPAGFNHAVLLDDDIMAGFACLVHITGSP